LAQLRVAEDTFHFFFYHRGNLLADEQIILADGFPVNIMYDR
jgi:hypothetical protein